MNELYRSVEIVTGVQSHRLCRWLTLNSSNLPWLTFLAGIAPFDTCDDYGYVIYKKGVMPWSGVSLEQAESVRH
ncbi:MAG: hypothetical protein LBH85_04870 [Treponema sp.]|nr:hypothetical protein [Treponema sp.]